MSLTILEIVYYRNHPELDEHGYSVKDTATSLAMGIGSIAFDLIWKIPIVAVYVGLYQITPFRLPLEWWSIALALLAQDFIYYWSHRSHHVIRILWASHVVHHSSRNFNLSTALRQPWTGFTAWVFYLPLIFIGAHPSLLAFCSSVNLVYQFWIHTERIHKLPRGIEFIFNTPSHHRVHHASQGDYLDRNFGGVLILWDRIFRTFAAERQRCDYGLTKNISTFNPIRVAIHEYLAIGRAVAESRTWSARLGYIFGSPGWRPNRETK